MRTLKLQKVSFAFPLRLGMVLAATMTAWTAMALDDATLKELTPTGKLRAGLVFAPTASAFFVVKEAEGAPKGVTADLAAELARQLGVPLKYVLVPGSGLVTDALEAGAVDVGFMPVDEERKKRVAFGPAYVRIESTYLATGASGIETVADADKPGMRLIGIANTTTIRASARSLKTTSISPVSSVEEGMAMLRYGKADALALSRDALGPLAAQLPGSRIAYGNFQETGIAIAVAKDRPQALTFVTEFLKNAKASGLVRQALDRAGFKNEAVAP